MSPLLRPLPAIGLVALAAVLVHARGLGGGFVYDDSMLIVDNPQVRSLERPDRFFSDPETLSQHGALHSYRPLRTLLFAVQWRLFGDRPAGYHVVSLLLHALVSVLVLLLVRRWTGSATGACLAALLFAVHPVTTEAVAWISIQGALVSTAGLLGALLLLDEPRPRRVLAAAALFLVAAGAKESAVVLPALLAVRALWLRRAAGSGRRWVIACVAILGVALAYTVVRQVMVTVVASETSAHRVFYGGSWWSTVGAFLSGTVYYLGSLLLPIQLTLRWSPPAPPESAAQVALLVAGAVLVAAILLGSVALRRRRPLLSAGLLMALLSLGPASSVLIPLPLITELRYLYPALPFLAVAVAPALGRRPVWLAAAAVLLLAPMSVHRTRDWAAEEDLWRSALARPRSTPEALYNLAHARILQAADHYRNGRLHEELLALLETRALFLRYIEERQENLHLVHSHERERVGGLLTEVAERLLDFGRFEDALAPAEIAASFGGRTARRLRLQAAALDALGRREEAETLLREADRLPE